MNILLHTIALEPARWEPQRVSAPLADLLPTLEGAGFYKLEVFEPHLTLAPDEGALAELFARHHLSPMVLSSYLDLAPAANPHPQFVAQARELLARIERFKFQKVRLFAGMSPSLEPADETARVVAQRLRHLSERAPEVEFLLETHEGALADKPIRMVRLLEECARPNVGLLWQPTVFDPDTARVQFDIQKAHIRHFHLQNRTPEGELTSLKGGVIPWEDLLRALNFGADASIEMVPGGAVASEEFDLSHTVQEAVEEFDWVARLER